MYQENRNFLNGQYNCNQYDYTYVSPKASQMHQANQIYINKNFVKTSSTVLVNPNFSRQVHVNPNFSKQNQKVQQVLAKTNTVFINPNIIKASGNVPQGSSTTSTLTHHTTTTNDSKLVVNSSRSTETSAGYKLFSQSNLTKTTVQSKYSKINNLEANNKNFIRTVKTQYSLNNLVAKDGLVSKNNAILKTKTKLIRVQPHISPTVVAGVNQKALPIKKEINLNKSFKSKQIISRHKLVRNNSPKSSMFKAVVKSKYKLVRSSNASPRSPRVKKHLRKLFISLLSSPNKYKLDNRTRRASCTVIKSRYKLTKKAYMMRLNPQNSIIKNTKFKMIKRGDTKVGKHINDGGKKKEHILKRKKFAKRNLVKINKWKLQKNNIPCEIYNKKGVCKRFLSGKCSRKHEPNQIQICIWFLQGICRDDKCTLSHKASPEKMPTCKFFLEGICHKDNCPYLHVKLSKDAPVCRDFLNGYCAKALECDKRHQFLCPDFERDGKCSKKLCRYPHGKAVRQYKDKLLNVIARNKKSKVEISTRESRPTKAQKQGITLEVEPKVEQVGGASGDSKRYYECPSDEHKGEKKTGVKKGNEDEIGSIFHRPKLGSLPSFISL